MVDRATQTAVETASRGTQTARPETAEEEGTHPRGMLWRLRALLAEGGRRTLEEPPPQDQGLEKPAHEEPTPSTPDKSSGSASPEEDQGECWACGDPRHRIRQCRYGKTRCYRCGRPGFTVRTCPECRQGWLAQGPYIPGRGHPGPDPPGIRRLSAERRIGPQ